MITAVGKPVVLTINDDDSMSGEARRRAAGIAAALGFDEPERGKVALVATEAATNLCKHAHGGKVVLQGLEHGRRRGIDILTLDQGPGMVDVARCMADGYSTAGSPGTGLGAMSRLSDAFQMYSSPGGGTAVFARLWTDPPPPTPLSFGSVSLPVQGEEVCGDHWALDEVDGRTVILVVDGLGHGPQAAEAAHEAIRVFQSTSSRPPAEIVEAAHAAMRGTRGAALAVARLDHSREEAEYVGIGNISGMILAPGEERSTSMVSHGGIVGHTIRKVQEFRYSWPSGSVLIMYSDGLGTHWRLGQYPGLASKHPGLIAGVLYRDFARGRDDVTVVSLRHGSQRGS